MALPSGPLAVEPRPLPIELLLPFDHPACEMYSTASSSLLLGHLWHGATPRLIDLEMDTRRLPHVEAVRNLVSQLV
ncbi:MAG: hypothetical protein JJU18_13410 [Oceanicaulis sp.]|nr:hypothetical protein [Oceanicaulis sp.]